MTKLPESFGWKQFMELKVANICQNGLFLQHKQKSASSGFSRSTEMQKYWNISWPNDRNNQFSDQFWQNWVENIEIEWKSECFCHWVSWYISVGQLKADGSDYSKIFEIGGLRAMAHGQNWRGYVFPKKGKARAPWSLVTLQVRTSCMVLLWQKIHCRSLREVILWRALYVLGVL